ncbi:MAG TPA: DUF3455 domain-containing protein [Anaeromyxobacteraceae bacterium]|nr:DUF3455 domain-containing protein [Anaeromyxobacteraceae bacterium]
MSLRFAESAAAALAVVLPCGCATTAPARATAPAVIQLPAGEEASLALGARGTQNYECRSQPDGSLAWAFVAPEADLLDAAARKVGRHYAGPTWESLADGSKVVGVVKARVDSPDADAIPWLLLASKESSGQGTFAAVRSIQRLDTRGGKAPAGPCANAGEVLKVPYTATYVFSRASAPAATPASSGMGY